MVILHVCEALYVIVLQSLTKCWNMALKIELPSPSHLTMLVWKIQMKSHVDCVCQHCKGKGAGRVDGVSTTFVQDCSLSDLEGRK